eukprot:TRINITY_DN26736_c0_g1_i1.p1 TRINITY_DN26736_c0_g1~~TRINITY_DN26736_c0_g1_i1.p1  ORF type:complete len:627 (-),score=122.22 TRINITY_DN26736_c0_g1_i1:216-2096(-)
MKLESVWQGTYLGLPRPAGTGGAGDSVTDCRTAIGPGQEYFSDVRLRRLLQSHNGDPVKAAFYARKHLELREQYSVLAPVRPEIDEVLQTDRFRYLGNNREGKPIVLLDWIGGKFGEWPGGCDFLLEAYVVFIRRVAAIVTAGKPYQEPAFLCINTGGAPPIDFVKPLVKLRLSDFPEQVEKTVICPLQPADHTFVMDHCLAWMAEAALKTMHAAPDAAALARELDADPEVIPAEAVRSTTDSAALRRGRGHRSELLLESRAVRIDGKPKEEDIVDPHLSTPPLGCASASSGEETDMDDSGCRTPDCESQGFPLFPPGVLPGQSQPFLETPVVLAQVPGYLPQVGLQDFLGNWNKLSGDQFNGAGWNDFSGSFLGQGDCASMKQASYDPLMMGNNPWQNYGRGWFVERGQWFDNELRQSGDEPMITPSEPSKRRTKPKKPSAPCAAPGAENLAPGERTTISLRNIPSSCSRNDVAQLLDEAGFRGQYDFLYMPMDFRLQASFGYAFVNFLTHQKALDALEHFDGFSDWRTEQADATASKNLCQAVWSAELQGLRANVERYRNSPIMHPSVSDEQKPAFYRDGKRQEFPGPTKKLRPPKVRHNPSAKGYGAKLPLPADMAQALSIDS